MGKPWLCQFSSQEKCCGVFSENYCALYLIESRKLSRSLASASYSCQLSAIKTIRLTQKPPVCLCPPGGFSVSEWCQDTCPGAIVLQIRKVKNTEKIVSLPLLLQNKFILKNYICGFFYFLFSVSVFIHICCFLMKLFLLMYSIVPQ